MDSFAALRFPSLPFSRRKAAAREIVGNQTLTPAPVSDESLLNQICAGDREALAALFERYARLTLPNGEELLAGYLSSGSAESSTAPKARRGPGSSRWRITGPSTGDVI